VLDAGILLLAAAIDDGLHVDSVWSALAMAALLGILTSVVLALLAIDDDATFQRRALLRAARQREVERADVPGVFFLEIDGLSVEGLRRAIRDGHVPTLARWHASGSHRIIGWECDLSSQTSASQAGLLFGDNHDIPAFRWFEKEHGRTMVSNHPRDAAELERRHSSGTGLLAVDGASRGNLCSGDAPRSLFTMSTALQRGREARGDLDVFLADPAALVRTLALSVADLFHEVTAALRQRRQDVRPRVSRGGIYPLLRVVTTVVLRDVAIQTLVGDLLRGVPVTYSTFVGYDEVAHHSGVERPDALDVLRRLDRQFARLERVAELAPRPYHFVVLSDHGQSQGATFRQRYGQTLEEVVRDLLRPGTELRAVAPADEVAWSATAALTEVAGRGDPLARTVRIATRGRDDGGAIEVGPARRETEQAGRADEPADVLIMPSGNLALIHLPEGDRRLTREELDERHPRLLPALRAHAGVGFVVVHGADDGPVVLGAHGEHRLRDGAVLGDDPLAPFGPNAARHVARHATFDHAPEIVVNGMLDPDTGEVAAFEELVGSHGGLGGPQGHPFVLAPAGFPVPDEPLVGAEHVHVVLKSWLAHVGHAVAMPRTEDRSVVAAGSPDG